MLGFSLNLLKRHILGLSLRSKRGQSLERDRMQLYIFVRHMRETVLSRDRIRVRERPSIRSFREIACDLCDVRVDVIASICMIDALYFYHVRSLCISLSLYLSLCVSLSLSISLSLCLSLSVPMWLSHYGVATMSRLLKWQVSFAKYHLFYRALSQKRDLSFKGAYSL